MQAAAGHFSNWAGRTREPGARVLDELDEYRENATHPLFKPASHWLSLLYYIIIKMFKLNNKVPRCFRWNSRLG